MPLQKNGDQFPPTIAILYLDLCMYYGQFQLPISRMVDCEAT